jgi:hypothetical protein
MPTAFLLSAPLLSFGVVSVALPEPSLPFSVSLTLPHDDKAMQSASPEVAIIDFNTFIIDFQFVVAINNSKYK